MKKLNLNLSSFLVFFFLNCSFSYSEDVKNIYGKPIVIDGDTINLNNKVIRFSGIDAPENYYRGKEQACYLNKKKNWIIFVGKLNRAKGYDLFGRAVIKILNKFPSWKAIAIGDEPREKLFFSHKNLKKLVIIRNT